MNSKNYNQISTSNLWRKKVKYGKKNTQEHMVFFERYRPEKGDDIYFEVIWKRIGTGGACEVFSITEITSEVYDKIP